MGKKPSQQSKLHYEAIPGGGVCSARGFSAAGMHAGFKKKVGSFDFALVNADEACPSAGVFTKNIFCAAPVQVSRKHLDDASYGYARAILINSGNANAATGDPGLEAAEKAAASASEALACKQNEVLLASTGVIGVQLSLALFTQNMSELVKRASRKGGNDAATAIMTTDTRAKECAVSYVSQDSAYEGRCFTVGGMAKGAGMIMPDMATLIAVITTDAPLKPELVYKSLVDGVDKSFNKVTIDSDTSTNDSCFLMASGQAACSEEGFEPFDESSLAYSEFLTALEAVCVDLARQIAADGEGATRLITVNVKGAVDDRDADLAARAIANSPLVKTAVFGRDANWGRVAMAIGKSGAHFRQEDVSIDFLGMPVCRGGLTVEFDEEEALRRFEAPEIVIDVDLGAGKASTTMWTCDFSHDYVTINGDYRT